MISRHSEIDSLSKCLKTPNILQYGQNGTNFKSFSVFTLTGKNFYREEVANAGSDDFLKKLCNVYSCRKNALLH